MTRFIANCVCNELDHVCGIGLCLSRDYVDLEYSFTPKTFIVEEIVDWRRLGFSSSNGEYVVFRVVKKGLETRAVARLLAESIGVPVENIVYLGLKDRSSTSIQYFFVKKYLLKGNTGDLVQDNVVVKRIGYTRVKPKRSMLVGNRFTLILWGSGRRELEKTRVLMRLISERGLPAYYGYQRFGITRPNTHYIGKSVFAGDYGEAYREYLYGMYLGESRASIMARLSNAFTKEQWYEKMLHRGFTRFKSYVRAWLRLDRSVRVFVENAFQAYLFNRLLTKIIAAGVFYDEICVPGRGCLEPRGFLEKILLSEGIGAATLHSVGGWMRRTVFYPRDVYVGATSGGVFVRFMLSRGFYASVVARELFKENLVLR